MPTSIKTFTSFGVNIFRIIGAINLNAQGWRRKLSNAYSTCVYFSVIINFISVWSCIILRRNDSSFWLNDILPSVTLLSIQLQMLTFIPKIKWLKKLLLEADFFTTYLFYNQLERYKKKALITSMIHELLFLIPITSISFNYFSNLFEITLNSWLTPDKLTSPIIKIWCVITCIFVIAFHIGFSCFFIYVVYYLQAYLVHLVDIFEIYESKDDSGFIITQRIRTIYFFDIDTFVSAHTFLMGLIKKTNKIFATHMLFKVWRCYLVLSLISVLPSELTFKAWPIIMRWMVFIFLSWELFNYCWLAEYIISKSMDLHEAVVARQLTVNLMMGGSLQTAEEVESLADTFRALEIIATVTQHGLELHAGPSYCLSCKTFTLVLGVACSYYLLLKSLK